MAFVPVFTDNFNRANADLDASADWELHNTTATSSRWAVNTNAIRLPQNSARRSCQLVSSHAHAAAQYAEVVVTHSGAVSYVEIGLGLCFQSQGTTENHYRFTIFGETGETDILYRIEKFVAGTNTVLATTAKVARPASGFNLRAERTADGNLHMYVNDSLVVETSTPDASFSSGQPGVSGFRGSEGGWFFDNFESGNITSGPSVNPTGTDTTLENGTSSSVVFQNLISNPVSVSVIYEDGVSDPISVVQSDFVLGAVTSGAATATFTDTVGNLPYTDTTYPAANYSYLVTCADDSTFTFSTLTFNPSTGRSFVTALDPVNDNTSVLTAWNSGVAVTGDQIDYPTAEATIREDFTHFYTGKTSESPPLVYEIGYWDSVTQTRYIVEITVNFNEGVVQPPVITNFRQLSIGFGIGFGI